MSSTNVEPPSIAVVSAVAREEGESPEELSPPLWNTIDPEALDLLFANGGSTVRVSFEYRGYAVEVDEDGVTVENRFEHGPEDRREPIE